MVCPLFFSASAHSIERSPDGQCLILSSRDGYCTIVVFDDILPAHQTQQQALQMQSIAQHHSVPLTAAAIPTPLATPSLSASSLPTLPPSTSTKRREPSVTPSTSGHAEQAASLEQAKTTTDPSAEDAENGQGPPKKKRRVALTRVGDVGS
jgi:chromatin assembly factor 1 subunit B